MTEQKSANKNVYVIGVTGSIGCGKSLVGKQLQEMGIGVLDTDHLAHELLNNPGPAYTRILERFGKDLVSETGGPIDRKKLGAIVFQDAAARGDLEAIMHPAIAQLQRDRVAALGQKHPVVAVLVPLLFETKSRDRYNEVWTIIVHKDVQMARLKLRDKLSDEELRRRINAQLPQEKKAEWADVVIDNSSSPEVTRGYVLEKVQALYKRLGITPEPT